MFSIALSWGQQGRHTRPRRKALTVETSPAICFSQTRVLSSFQRFDRVHSIVTLRGTRTQIIKSHHFFPCRMRSTITQQLFRVSVSLNTRVQQADLLPSPWKRYAPSLWRLASVTRQSRLARRITRLPPPAPLPPPLAARLAQTAARLPRMRALASLRIMSFFLSAYEGVSSMRCAGKNKDTRRCDLSLLPVGTIIKCMCLVCLEAFSTSVGTACMHEAAGILQGTFQILILIVLHR